MNEVQIPAQVEFMLGRAKSVLPYNVVAEIDVLMDGMPGEPNPVNRAVMVKKLLDICPDLPERFTDLLLRKDPPATGYVQLVKAYVFALRMTARKAAAKRASDRIGSITHSIK